MAYFEAELVGELTNLIALCVSFVLVVGAVAWWRRYLPRIFSLRLALVIVVVSTVVVGAFLCRSIVLRYMTGDPARFINDSGLQLELALARLTHGQSPYGVTYYGTALERYDWGLSGDNPALFHFAYLPGMLYLSYPGYVMSPLWPGFFDVRLVVLAAFFSLVILFCLRTHASAKAVWIVPLVVLNFFLVPFVGLGYFDVVVLALVAWSLHALESRHEFMAALLLGIALATKQTAWFVVPFYLMFAYARGSWGVLWRMAINSTAVALGLAMPFLLTNYQGFIVDTVGYALGVVAHSYPIRGIGLSELLYLGGIVDSRWSTYPFWLWQLVIGLPLLGYLLYQAKQRLVSAGWVLQSWAVWLGVVWYVSRFFTVSHLSFVMSVAAAGVLWQLLESGLDRKISPGSQP